MKGRVLVAVQFGCLIALALLPSAGTASPWRELVARLAVLGAAVVLGIAFINLRPSVTVLPEPRDGVPFITTGIYAYVRHPMYLGVLLFGTALTLSKWTWATALVFVVLAVDLRIKYRYEDRLLAARWSNAMTYQAHVGALLPRSPKGWRQP